MVGGINMTRFPLVIAVSERDMQGIEPGLLGWHTSALTNEFQKVNNFLQSDGYVILFQICMRKQIRSIVWEVKTKVLSVGAAYFNF